MTNRPPSAAPRANLTNPLRLLRLQKSISQAGLARDAGIHRTTLLAIEDGVTREPDLETCAALGAVLGVPAQQLRSQLVMWASKQKPAWTVRQASIIQQPHTNIPRAYTSFRQWRLSLEPNAARFAAALGVSRHTLTNYERAIRVKGMPDALLSGLLEIGLSSASVDELSKLPTVDDDDD